MGTPATKVIATWLTACLLAVNATAYAASWEYEDNQPNVYFEYVHTSADISASFPVFLPDAENNKQTLKNNLSWYHFSCFVGTIPSYSADVNLIQVSLNWTYHKTRELSFPPPLPFAYQHYISTEEPPAYIS